MKKITCKKPCNIGGERFAIGDDVPVELIAPSRETALVKYGLISIENVPENLSESDGNDARDGGTDSQQTPSEGQQTSDEGQQSDTNGEDDQNKQEKPDDITPESGKKKSGKRGKE